MLSDWVSKKKKKKKKKKKTCIKKLVSTLKVKQKIIWKFYFLVLYTVFFIIGRLKFH